LLELLSDFQVTIPELGTRRPVSIPLVLLTSNNYRDMSDALKRRCLHLYIDYPEPSMEKEIVKMKLPGIREDLLDQLIRSVSRIRELDLKKKPCISESIDWARSLMALEINELTPVSASDTLNSVCKYRSDIRKVRQQLDTIL